MTASLIVVALVIGGSQPSHPVSVPSAIRGSWTAVSRACWGWDVRVSDTRLVLTYTKRSVVRPIVVKSATKDSCVVEAIEPKGRDSVDGHYWALSLDPDDSGKNELLRLEPGDSLNERGEIADSHVTCWFHRRAP